MKVSMKNAEILTVVFLYLLALYIWTLPIHENRMPFGDVDASSHFTIGDYMASTDRSVAKIPYPITFRYGGQNTPLPEYIWYPPQYWTNGAIGQVLGGERILPFFIFVAIFSSLIILSSYFLIRSLFGFWPAFLSSFLLIFSTRDYMIYLWGQWPQSLSFAFTPLVLYSYFQYHRNYKEKINKPVYLYFLALFLAAQFFFHPQGMIASAGALIIFNIILFAKDKRLSIDAKHAFLAFALFAALSAALAPLNIGEFFVELAKPGDSDGGLQFDKLFKWYHGIRNDPGLPDFYFTYNMTHGSLAGGFLSWWTLPFLLLGILFLAYRRDDKDILLLGWLVSFYFLTRLAVFGLGSRDIRMFAYEAHVFYPIIAIGLLSISSFFSNQEIKKFAKYGFIALFFILALSINAKSAYDILKGQQNSIARINPMQYEAALWLKDNVEERADIYDIGTLGYQNFGAKIKWLMVLSQRHFIVNEPELRDADYIFFDYTDGILLGSREYVDALQQIESQFSNATPTYDQNNIRVYRINGIQQG